MISLNWIKLLKGGNRRDYIRNLKLIDVSIWFEYFKCCGWSWIIYFKYRKKINIKGWKDWVMR